MRIYKNLEVYKKSRALVLKIYKATDSFPKKEEFNLTSQIRRAAVSVVANIVEGASKDSEKDFKNFLNIAIGSISELECLIDIASELKYLIIEDFTDLEEMINHTRRMLINLKLSIK